MSTPARFSLLITWTMLAPLAIALFAATSVGCLIPSDGTPPPPELYGPSIDVSTLDPLEPLTQLNPTCGQFEIRVETVVDEDSQVLLARWVLNNNLPGTALLDVDVLTAIEPGDEVGASVFTGPSDFSLVGIESGDAVVVSFFVTDAPRWANPPNPTPSVTEVQDLGAIPPRSGRSAEARWTFTFGPEGSGTCL